MFQEWGSCLDNGVATLKCLPIVFSNVVTALLMFVGITAAFFLVYGGMRFTTSGGDPKRLDDARKTMTFAIVGVIIVLLSFFIINVVSYSTGNDCIRQFNFDCK